MHADGGRVLVVDDEEDVLLLCALNLEAEGCEVLEARDGSEALTVARRSRPDLILLDIMMPGMNGIECLSQIRADPDLVDIPVVILTAKVDSEYRRKAMAAGADDYITKPFDPPALARSVPARLAVRHR